MAVLLSRSDGLFDVPLRLRPEHMPPWSSIHGTALGRCCCYDSLSLVATISTVFSRISESDSKTPDSAAFVYRPFHTLDILAHLRNDVRCRQTIMVTMKCSDSLLIFRRLVRSLFVDGNTSDEARVTDCGDPGPEKPGIVRRRGRVPERGAV